MKIRIPFKRRPIRDRRGATAIEYGLIAALIAIAAVSAMGAVGRKLSGTFNNVTATLNKASS